MRQIPSLDGSSRRQKAPSEIRERMLEPAHVGGYQDQGARQHPVDIRHPGGQGIKFSQIKRKAGAEKAEWPFFISRAIK